MISPTHDAPRAPHEDEIPLLHMQLPVPQLLGSSLQHEAWEEIWQSASKPKTNRQAPNSSNSRRFCLWCTAKHLPCSCTGRSYAHSSCLRPLNGTLPKTRCWQRQRGLGKGCSIPWSGTQQEQRMLLFLGQPQLHPSAALLPATTTAGLSLSLAGGTARKGCWKSSQEAVSMWEADQIFLF